MKLPSPKRIGIDPVILLSARVGFARLSSKKHQMKRLFVLIILFGCSNYLTAQDNKTSLGAVMSWDNVSYDFGEIYQGDIVEHTFRFVNTGTQDLVITNVEVTCGCTIPKGWPREPIVPEGTGELTVAFDSRGKMGKQNKVITVTSNSAGTSKNQVVFTATVLEKKQPDN